MTTNITAITVAYNTKDLIKRAYESFRKFHPDMQMLIIDGSDENNTCFSYLESIRSKVTEIYHCRKNIGHGRGMDKAINMITTKYAVIFDSDIVMLKSPVEQMIRMMESDTFGVGWIYEIGQDGFDFGTPGRNHYKRVPYLHPYFHVINVQNYLKYKPYCHHGAPCYQTMIDIYDKGLSSKVLKHFAGLTGHTSGKGINWTGRPSEYIQHDFGGTRMANKKAGKKEIEGTWQR